MNKFVFKACLSALCVGVPCSPALTAADQRVDECSKELLLAYFPEPFVNETLKKFNVPEDQWSAIDAELNAKNEDVIRTVEDKAAKLSPNPLKDPEQRQVAVKIFRETLFDIFSKVVKAHGVTDDKQIQSMLEDIQLQKAKRFAMCVQTLESSTPSPAPAPADESH